MENHKYAWAASCMCTTKFMMSNLIGCSQILVLEQLAVVTRPSGVANETTFNTAEL